MLPDDSPARDLQAHPDPLGGAGRHKGIFSNKFRLLQLHAKVQPGLQGGDGLIHLMAVQGHCRLQAKGIPGTQAAGNEAERLPGLPENLPQLGGVLVGRINLIAQLSGIACAGDHARYPLYLHTGQGGVVSLGNLVLRQQALQDSRGFGPL